MERTKPKPKNTSFSRSKNVGTQTENFDNLIEVAKLEEQLKVLQLEIDVLRKHAETYNRPENIIRHKPSDYVNPQATPKNNVEKSNCGCKGNCSTRICGCVKKSNKCNPSCRCDDKTCQNQKSEHKENKENLNRDEVTLKRKKKAVEKFKNRGSLFSPDVREHYGNYVESEFNNIHFSFNKVDTVVKRSQVDSHINKVNIEKERKNEKEQQESNIKESEKVMFDPMKPRHQLSRTPTNKEKSPEVENMIQPQPHLKTTQEVLVVSPQDIKEEKVDWEEHTAQLIPCKKCKRTFMPDRIQKHEACCKKI